MLRALNKNKSSGPDGISARMLKATADDIAPSITALFNISIKCNRPPREWNKSHVVPLPKQKSILFQPQLTSGQYHCSQS